MGLGCRLRLLLQVEPRLDAECPFESVECRGGRGLLKLGSPGLEWFERPESLGDRLELLSLDKLE